MKRVNISSFALTNGPTDQTQDYDLVINTQDTATPTPIIIKTGNFKVYGSVSTDLTSSNIAKLKNVQAFIMYCPQGYSYTNDLLAISNHPEYIMGRTTLRFKPGENTSFSLSSRMKRNLNTGDKIKLVIVVEKDTSLTGNLNVYGNYQWYTCAN